MIKFTKMEGLGNDYVYVDCTKQNLENASNLAKIISDRHFGVGSDGLILIKSSKKADFRMQMFNSDGTEAEMCGNGIRCVGKYVYDKGLTDKTTLKIETLAGIKVLNLNVEGGKVKTVKVDMGEPILDYKLIPAKDGKVYKSKDGIKFYKVNINIEGDLKELTCVSMGNPHAVIFLDDIDNIDINYIGSYIENNNIFPNRTNVEFVKIISRGEVKQRTWERGSGETLACGTGASAVCAAGFISGRTDNIILNHLLGGDLILRYENNQIFMKGEARYSFEGKIKL